MKLIADQLPPEIARQVHPEKLRVLEARYEANKQEQGGDDHVRQLSMSSLKRLINPLKEEIARFETRTSLRTNGG